jgi:hypothetical protein
MIGAPPRGSPKDFGTPVAKIDSPRGESRPAISFLANMSSSFNASSRFKSSWAHPYIANKLLNLSM